MDYEKEIVKKIKALSGSRSLYDVFCDWTKCAALSISNVTSIQQDEIWKEREEEYLKTIKPYGADGREFADMQGALTLALEEEMQDILGKIYMDSGCGNKNTGQFFTPFHVSEAVAALTLPENVSPDNPLILNEPSCGGGGMIIAAAKVLRDRGVDYQRSMKVVAQDLDWKGVYMTYIQLSLLGIDAIVVQGDSLTQPFTSVGVYPKERTFRTPRQKGCLL